MQWIDEMFAGMEKDRAAELVKRSAKETHVHRTEHLKEENPDTEGLWSALTSAISKDVNEFNLHKERTGQIAVHISNRHHQCEVYLPGMQSKRLVLALEDNELKVSIHPDFPSQQLAITIEHDQEGRHGFWVLGDHSKENAITYCCNPSWFPQIRRTSARHWRLPAFPSGAAGPSRRYSGRPSLGAQQLGFLLHLRVPHVFVVLADVHEDAHLRNSLEFGRVGSHMYPGKAVTDKKYCGFAAATWNAAIPPLDGPAIWNLLSCIL
jgi:hypothetical protein